METAKRLCGGVGCAALLLACGQARLASSHVEILEQQPLASDEVQLVPASEEPLLGRVIDRPLSQLLDEEGVPADADAAWLSQLAQQSRPNPCAEHLRFDSAPQTEKAAELLPIATVPSWLGATGLSDYAGLTSHALLRVDYTQEEWVEELPGYALCCFERGCGVARVDAVRLGEQRVDAAMVWQSLSPPLVFLARSGHSLGIGLHEGRSSNGVVAATLRSAPR